MKATTQKAISFLVVLVMLMGLILPSTAFAVDTESGTATDNQDAGSTATSSAQAPEGYVPRTGIGEQTPTMDAQDVGDAEDLPKVLLIQDVLPWDSTANQDVLEKITEYDVTTTTKFLNVELEEYGVVVFANDQPFDTYQNYESFKEYLELFASLGGVIVFGACDAGWAGGDLNEMLPGNVSKQTHYVEKNHVADSTHMIISGALTDNVPLTDDELVSNYCSHVSFDEETIPAGSKILIRESDTNRPTLIEYPLGDGRVIASGLTWEHNYVRGGTGGRGSFAMIAMEDMFRYAIRVSSIDVDELHVLEEWRISKKTHAIIVADGSGDKNNLNPISGAKVVIDGMEYVTDEDGVVITTDYGEKIVEVFADGYRDCKEFYELKEQSSRIFFMEKDKGDGLPYITLCTAAKNGKAPYVDLRTQALHYAEDKGHTLVLWLQGNWNGHGEGTFNVYQESANGEPGKMFEIPVGNYLNIAPGNIFDPNAQIKVQMVAADGTRSEIIDLNIEIDKAPPKTGEVTSTTLDERVTSFEWLGEFPIASDNDVFTKLLTTDMSFAGDLIPVQIAKSFNDDGTITYRGAIGICASEDSKELLDDGEEPDKFDVESAWDEFTDQIKNFKNAKNPKQYFENLKDKYAKLLVPSKLETGFGDPELDVCGYFEVTYNFNNEVVSSDGGMIITGAANYEIGKTFMAGPVPLYFEFAPAVEIEVNTGINFYNENDALTFKPFFKGTEVAIPSISLEGGVGVRGVVTAGLNGTGKLLVTFPGTDDPDFNVDLSLDGSVHINVLLLAEYNWSFASTEIHFYPKNKAATLMSVAMDEVEPEISLVSRDYLTNATEWNGTAASLMAADNTETAAVLQEGVMPQAMPQIHQIGDQQIMLFLRDVQGCAIGNHTQLVYSVCQDGVWSAPQPVWESESADFFFSSAVANDKLVVAWQKSSDAAISENAEDLLAEIAANSEICFASWDAETGSFSNQMYLTDNDLVDMMPAVASNGENVTVSWIRNDVNNVVGAEGNYEIYQTSITAEGAQSEQLLYTTEDYVVEIAAGMNESGTQLIFAAMNKSDTVDLYCISGGTVTKLVSGENPAGLSYADGMFLWQEDGSIFSYIPGAAGAETLITADVASISSSYEYVTNGTGASVVWTNVDENGYQVNASIRVGETWTTPVSLMSGEDDTVPFMDAVLLDNGNYSIILNTASYNDKQSIDRTALTYANVAPKTSVSIELAELNYPDWENGTQEINIALENRGSIPVYNATVSASCENGTILNKTLDIELMPGDCVIIAETMDIRSVNQEMTGTIDIQIANDVDTSDNTMTVILGQVDTALDLDVYENGDDFLFVLTASNNSNTDANAALSIIEDSLDGVVLNVKNIGVITNTENVQYLFTIDRSKVDFAGKETKTYFFSLSTLETDWCDADNVLTYTIKAPNNIESDPDGEMEIIEMILPERLEITEDSLHFSSLDDESVQLHATVYPEGASDRAVFWSAENNDIVHITEDGLVTPLRKGVTAITAMIDEGIADTIVVSVVAHNPFTDIKESDYFYTPVLWAYTNNITTGTTPTTFSPNNACTRAQIVTFLWRAMGEPEPQSNTTPFTDLDKNEYYYKAVLWAVEEGITTGMSATTFEPNRACTRSQAVTFQWRAAGCPTSSASNPFADIPTGQWYTEAVLWAVEQGITTGMSADKFAPNNTCTRAHIVTFLYRNLSEN